MQDGGESAIGQICQSFIDVRAGSGELTVGARWAVGGPSGRRKLAGPVRTRSSAYTSRCHLLSRTDLAGSPRRPALDDGAPTLVDFDDADVLPLLGCDAAGDGGECKDFLEAQGAGLTEGEVYGGLEEGRRLRREALARRQDERGLRRRTG